MEKQGGSVSGVSFGASSAGASIYASVIGSETSSANALIGEIIFVSINAADMASDTTLFFLFRMFSSCKISV
jgi:hypothetical protein